MRYEDLPSLTNSNDLSLSHWNSFQKIRRVTLMKVEWLCQGRRRTSYAKKMALEGTQYQSIHWMHLKMDIIYVKIQNNIF